MASLAERHRARFDQRHAWSYRSRVDLTGSSRRSDANLRARLGAGRDHALGPPRWGCANPITTPIDH